MKRMKPSLVLASAAVVGLAVVASGYVEQTGTRMATAAGRFVGALGKEQAAKAVFPYDSPERLNWHFIPRDRKGIPIKELTPAQRALAFGLIATGTGGGGYLKATTIMSLEQVLLELEKGRGPVRDPERYFLTIFGTPSDTGKWGWRVEGHHLSLNFAIEDGKVVGATPTFFGSNPAEVREGPRQGVRTLADREDTALRLVQALDGNQQKTAIVAPEAPRDIRAANTPQPPADAAPGIAYDALNADQKGYLRALIDAYSSDMPDEVAKSWLDEIRRANPEGIRFAWYGPADRTRPHAYRVQGPTFLIEFNNTQNNANHIHSVWRNMLGDFAIPVAAK
ncbi:hypothetical protein OJF2_29290 [Aquisphaera giovannonii]|uniref:DUF3500 domain-containing protein n=1 Tax=Aquisphaera giovannonii TaxID=406548 RepID=A0A5B9W363_9BACT|nr:DUF3500 domain-containing protein [Aquisphaera giovannonii]QEH34390.1 hypothetical protein OJF2_29290 [Aquisphaera giovannonii]